MSDFILLFLLLAIKLLFVVIILGYGVIGISLILLSKVLPKKYQRKVFLDLLEIGDVIDSHFDYLEGLIC